MCRGVAWPELAAGGMEVLTLALEPAAGRKPVKKANAKTAQRKKAKPTAAAGKKAALSKAGAKK